MQNGLLVSNAVKIRLSNSLPSFGAAIIIPGKAFIKEISKTP